jgi:hypothetical protein
VRACRQVCWHVPCARVVLASFEQAPACGICMLAGWPFRMPDGCGDSAVRGGGGAVSEASLAGTVVAHAGRAAAATVDD